MRLINYVLLALSSLLYATQVWGYVRHFRSDAAPSWRLRAMSVSFMAAYAAQAVALWPGRPLAQGAWLAAPLCCLGLALWSWAIQASGRGRLALAFSNDRPQALIEEGPYRYVRHPFYTAYMLHWLAGFVATLDVIVTATGLAAATLCVAAATREERRFAASVLGPAYQAYRQRTGMFLPSVIRHT
jgi:protein-S-isoprenylcysteine O-methyltransferase Ste14